MSTTKKPVVRLVTRAALRIVRLDKIGTDESYQRTVKSRHKRIVNNFNADALGIPVVGERSDGTLWIVDGLQRITALRALNRTEVRVEIFNSRGPEHEAEVFKLINMNRTAITSAEEFKALLTAHDEQAWEIKKAAESCGYTMLFGKRQGKNAEKEAKQLTCFNLLRMITKTHGVDPIKFALTVVKESWPDDRLGTYNTVIGGLCKFYVRRDGAPDMERLLVRTRATSPQKIIYATQQMAIGASRIEVAADVIEKIYQKRYTKR